MRVVVEDVSVRFGSRTVHDGLSLQVDSGQSVAIVGPSGSGKSTLLAVIGGVQRPDAGQISVQPGVSGQQISWIFQTVSALQRRSVIDNIMLGSHATSETIDDARARAFEAAHDVGLDHVRDAPVRTISGGERQRMVVARCLVSEPGLVLADEPTAQLDRHNAEVVSRSLVRHRSAQTTVIIATHDDVVAAQCERTLTLRDGRLHEQ